MKYLLKNSTMMCGSFVLLLYAFPFHRAIAEEHHVRQNYKSVTKNRKVVPHVEQPSVISHNRENIGVVAHPYRSQTIKVSSSEFQRFIPGTNPLKVIGQLPGVMFQSDDPQGLDTWSAQIMMHGFQQQEIGMTLDGIPLGEMTYRNYNGTNPLQAISSENIANLDVSRSAGAETVAATNNLGGSIEYISSDPKDKLGGQINQTFGSNSTYHTFIRFDSGKLNSSGTKFFVSYMRNESSLWKGYGQQFLQQVNAKFVQPVEAIVWMVR